MKTMALTHLRLRTILLGGAAAILTWLVISRSLAAYLADVSPQAALWVDSQQPQALVNLADRSLNPSIKIDQPNAGDADQAPRQELIESGTGIANQSAQPDSKFADGKLPTTDHGATNLQELDREFEKLDLNRSVDLPAIRAWATAAVMKDPLNARALRVLGQVADASRDDADASKFMQTAARLSLHDSIGLLWMMHKSTKVGDYKTAIYYADALLRTNPGLTPYVAPLLAHFAEQKASNGLLKTLLESDPPWRDVFFQYLIGNVSDARTPLDLLLALRTSPSPPDSAELGDYLAALIADKFYDLAYYTWLQFLPTEELRTAGLLFNGNFDVTPSGLPFDWVIKQGSGATVDIVPTKDDGHALMVDFLYGRVDYHSVSELVLLAPGTYQFDGQYKGKLVGPRGLKWRLVCAGEARTRIGESSMIGGDTSTWKDIEFGFSVPATACQAQYVRLDLDARMASERLVSGSMLFNALRISRVANPPNKLQPSN
jgi:hypothetical protein